jgi:hypothetical protein
MWLHSYSNLQDILQSSRNAEKVMVMVMAVSTNQVQESMRILKYLILSLSFYPQDSENQPRKSKVKALMANTWTPKMYLSALNKFDQ